MSPAGAPSSEARRLAAIRGRVAALDGATWLLGAEGDAMIVEAAGRDGTLVRLATFGRLATADEMELAARAPEDLRFLLGLVDRAIEAARRRHAGGPAAPPSAERKDFAAECAMKCAEPAFRAWLEATHGLAPGAGDDDVARAVRAALKVRSRAELNAGGAALARWRDMRRAFRAWMAGRVE